MRSRRRRRRARVGRRRASRPRRGRGRLGPRARRPLRWGRDLARADRRAARRRRARRHRLALPLRLGRREGVSSLDLLARAYAQVREAGFELGNADCVLVGEEPRIAPLRARCRRGSRRRSASSPASVTVRATTTEASASPAAARGLQRSRSRCSARRADDPVLDPRRARRRQRGDGLPGSAWVPALENGAQRLRAPLAEGALERALLAQRLVAPPARGAAGASGHSPQRGTRARQTVAPRSISAWAPRGRTRSRSARARAARSRRRQHRPAEREAGDGVRRVGADAGKRGQVVRPAVAPPPPAPPAAG